MQKTIKQHYIPRFYLKRFANKEQISAYNFQSKQIINANVKNREQRAAIMEKSFPHCGICKDGKTCYYVIVEISFRYN